MRLGVWWIRMTTGPPTSKRSGVGGRRGRLLDGEVEERRSSPLAIDGQPGP